jgi:hypothetical protein
MGAVTYPDEKVTRFVDLNFIPVQIPTANAELMEKYVVKWTPTILVLDADGREHYRMVGFSTPEDFIANFMVGKGRWYLGSESFTEADGMFAEVLSNYPESDAAAEALFFQGVARYKHTHDPKALRASYDRLMEKYPKSMWAKQAAHYRLIPA